MRGTNNHGYIERVKIFRIRIGYRMLRNISFFKRRITVKTKNGIETNDAVEANGFS